MLADITGEKPATGIVTTPPAYVPKTKPSTTDAPTASAKAIKPTNESDANTNNSRKRKADDESWISRDKMPRSNNPLASQLDNVKSTSKPASPVTGAFSPPVSKVPPRKGTFAEIMSRKVQPTAVGIYKHKPKERATAEERAAYRKQKKGKGSIAMGSKVGNPTVAQQELFPDNQKRSKKAAEDRQSVTTSKKAVPPEPTYKGTARPRPREQPTYRGTARLNNKGINSSGSSRAGSAVPYGPSRHNREKCLDEDDEEDEDEDEDEQEEDYDSEASSDMEAAPVELEREEMRSRRIAELEDEEALREETRLRKQKEAKKRALAALAAAKQRR